MCQETIQKLKGMVKTSGQHKQRIFINVTLEGLKIIDGVNMVSGSCCSFDHNNAVALPLSLSLSPSLSLSL